MMPSIKHIMDEWVKDGLKEIFKFIILMLALSGLACWAYVGGQSYQEAQIEDYFEMKCGEVPRFHLIGTGLENYYVETFLLEDSGCIMSSERQLWVIPKEGGDE